MTLNMKEKPKLYIKSDCPWCKEAIKFFQEKGLEVDLVEISAASLDSMSKLATETGTLAVPTFLYRDFIVRDFDTNEFIKAYQEFAPEIVKQELNLKI